MSKVSVLLDEEKYLLDIIQRLLCLLKGEAILKFNNGSKISIISNNKDTHNL